MSFETEPMGPYSLAASREHAGGWMALGADARAVALAFPVEGTEASAAVIVRQYASGGVTGEVHGAGRGAETAWRQALETLCLDIDGAGFVEVGERDPVIGELQRELGAMRPVLLPSPYEAAVAAILGRGLSPRQARTARQVMAQLEGVAIAAGVETVHAFPRPAVLAGMAAFPGLPAATMSELRSVAQVAAEGRLDRGRLRSLPEEVALEELQALDGVGAGAASSILLHGAGLVDILADDEGTRRAVQSAYGTAVPPGPPELRERAEAWRPYRAWAVALLRAAPRPEPG